MVNRLRVTSAILWTLIILVLCWTPDIYLPVVEEEPFLPFLLPFPLDKYVHAGIFAVFGVLWLRALRGEKWSYAWVFAAGIALAVITELGQMIPIVHREGEVIDAIADLVGLALSVPIFLVLEKYFSWLAVRRGPLAEGHA